ncbi:hypothetical protein Tco_0449305 [Tanacetum coccineum]
MINHNQIVKDDLSVTTSFVMEVPMPLISDAIKTEAGYIYYYGLRRLMVNAPNKLKKVVVPRKTRSLTIDKETVVDMYNEWGQKLKGPAIDDPTIQSLFDLQNGSKASRLESLRQKKQAITGEGSSATHSKHYVDSDTDSDATLYSSSSNKTEESVNETDDADESDMDLYDDNPGGDNDAVRYGVFMHNKSTATPNSTYLSPTVTSFSLDFIQTLLDKTPANELMDFMSHPVYTDAQTTSVVYNLEGNPELTSYILGASEVPLGTHIDVLATKTILQEMVPDENAHHIPSLPNMRKINFKKAVAQKFKEYVQKLEALTNFNVFEAFEKAVQAKVLTEIKKLLLTHILKAIANYVRPRLNTSVIEDPPNNRGGENKKKRRKDVGEPSSRSSSLNRSPVDENHILGPLIVAIAKKFKALIQKDELTIVDLEGAGLKWLKWNSDEGDVSKPRLFERHMSESTKPHLCFYNNDYSYLVDLGTEEKYTTSITKHYAARYYKEGIEDMIPERWSKEVYRYHFEALNESTKPHLCFYNNDYSYLVDLSTEEKYTTSITKHYAARYYKEGIEDMIPERWSKEVYRYHFEALNDLRIKSVVCVVVKKKWGYGYLTSIVVKRSDDKEYEFSYTDHPRLSLNDVEDMYLVQENLIDMLTKNKLGSRNKSLKGRDWTDYDVKSSKEMLKKIGEILRHREQLRRLEEYVGGHPKTVNPRTFVRPM